jgi:dihydrolipoamide dehydrogenase
LAVDKDAKSIERSLRKGNNPTLFKARARFIAERTLEVGPEKIQGKKIVIAAGARPALPPIQGLEKVPYLTSTEALRLTKLPKSLVIIGGGYIAAELGYFYAALGCKVTIIQRGPLLIPREDREVSEVFTRLWKQRYGIVCNCDVLKVEKKSRGVVVHTKHNGKEKKFGAEKLLIATGLKPNSDRLEVAKTGVKVNEKGFIIVNKYLETTAKNIWALGDIAGIYLFKHSANREAEYVLNAVLGQKQPVDYYPMPHAIFTSPQIAGVGLTEQDCQQQKRRYVVGKYYYQHTGMGAAMEEKDGLVKLLVDKKNKEILGCHILGPDASTLIHEVVVAMKADRFKALEILRTAVHVHPALSEVVQRAALSVPI